jgi:hypothetical protein
MHKENEMEQLKTGLRDGFEIEDLDRNLVEVRAYELWLKRGCPIGSAEVDWLQAEAELAQEARASKQYQTQAKAA